MLDNGVSALHRHRFTIGALIVAAAAVVVLVVSLGGSDNGSSRPSTLLSAAPLAHAATVTEGQPGYKVTLVMHETVGSRALTFGGFGTFSHRSGSMEVLADGRRFRELVAYPWIYEEVPGAASTPWVEINFTAFLQTLGLSLSLDSNPDPAYQLQQLEAAGSVHAVGTALVRGVPTTEYDAVIDLRQAATLAASGSQVGTLSATGASTMERILGRNTLPLQVWVDHEMRVRQESFSLSLCSSLGTIREHMTMDLYDFGKQPAVSPPPADEITNLTPQVTAAMKRGLAALGC